MFCGSYRRECQTLVLWCRSRCRSVEDAAPLRLSGAGAFEFCLRFVSQRTRIEAVYCEPVYTRKNGLHFQNQYVTVTVVHGGETKTLTSNLRVGSSNLS